jgi:hypothetical protein
LSFACTGQQLNEMLAASIAETRRRCYTKRLPLIIAAKQDDTHAPAEAFFRAFSMKSVCMPEC